jgi:uncharacterized membrane protein
MRLPLLVFHIAGGMVGLLSGTGAMVFRKGSAGHRLSGNVFVVSMLIMGTCGSTLALMKGQMNNVFGGLLTVYMITTAWLTGRRRDGQTNVFDWGAMVFGFAIATSLLAIGILVARGQLVGQVGVPLGMYFFMGMVPGAAAAGDLRMLVRGGVSGTPRIARHLWRMCFGLFIATGSFFLGQQQVIPAAIRKQYLLVPLAILPLVLLIYWLVRVRINGGRTLTFAKGGNLQRAA